MIRPSCTMAMPSSDASASPRRSVRWRSTNSAPKARMISMVEAAMTPPASQAGWMMSAAGISAAGTSVMPLIDVKCRTQMATTSSSVETTSLRALRST
ncbi:hypothetical protein D3C87_1614850 [compost metagenome]